MSPSRRNAVNAGCCDDLWSELGNSLRQNRTLHTLSLPIDPIASKPTGEEARLTLLNGMKQNFTVTSLTVPTKLLKARQLTSAYGWLDEISIFIHEDSSPFECYLDLNRRGRHLLDFDKDGDNSQVNATTSSSSSGKSRLSSAAWKRLLQTHGGEFNDKFDLDWLYCVSKANPVSLVWLRDSMIKKRVIRKPKASEVSLLSSSMLLSDQTEQDSDDNDGIGPRRSKRLKRN